jgi:glycosyltransferase involved in cell wall biosynthesis
MAPRLSVLIPTRNRGPIVERVIQGIASDPGAAALGKRGLEVLALGDGCTDDTGARVERLRGSVPFALRWFALPQGGANAARNVGLREAAGELVLILNDDTIPQPGCLPAHLAFHERMPDQAQGALGRVTLDPAIPGTLLRSLHLDRSWRGLEGRTQLTWREFWTANLSLKKRFLDRTQVRFDESLRYVHDDVEMGWRLETFGLRLWYVPEALAHHHHPLTLEEYLRMGDREGASLALWDRRLVPRFRRLLRAYRYTPALPLGARLFKYALLDLAVNPVTEPLVLAAARASETRRPALASLLYGAAYARRKRAAIRRVRRGGLAYP